MKRRKRWLLALALSGPTVTNFSCTTTLGAALRDAAIDGAAAFVQDSITAVLDQAFGPDATE